MRVCHVSPHLPPDQAANALLPAQLGRWSAARGTVVSFVTQPPAQGAPGSGALSGPVHHTRARSRSRLLRAARIDTWRRTQSILRALDQAAGEADLLHLHSNGLIVEVAAHWARQRHLPVVLTLYGTEIWHYRRRWPIDPFTRAYQSAAEVAFYSQGLLDKARELGLGRKGLTVVYPAVSETFQPADPETRARWKADLGIAEALVVLNVKRLHELAGQRFLIDAFARVAAQHNDVRLVICGTGPLRTELEAQARATGAADRVTFTGLLPNDAIARHAAVADVFVLPSLLEALPTVAVEALAAGTPVVSADHPGGTELQALFGDDVQVVPRENVEALTSALEAALASPRRTLPSTAQIVQDLFSPRAVMDAYADLYQRVLGARA